MECLRPLYLDQELKHFVSFRDLRTRKLVKVPCGKCVNCLKNKQNKLVVRIVTESQNYGSMHFVTLTYKQETLPLSATFYGSDGKIDFVMEHQRILEPSPFLNEMREKIATIPASSSPRYFDFPLSMFQGAYGEGSYFWLRITPSLNRLDFRLWLKRCRVEYKRKFGQPLPNFKYLFCGEYGSRSARPHYHVLFLGLSSAQVDWMCRQWDLGFTYWKRCNTDTKDKYAVARYVSKYMTKGSFDCESVKSRHAEKPRYAMSKHFGESSLPLEHFYCFDIFGKYDPDTLKLEKGDYLTDKQIIVLSDEIFKRQSICIPGAKCRFPLPDTWKKKIYYNKVVSENSEIAPRYVPKTIYKIVQEIALARDIQDSEREFELFRKSQKDCASLSEIVVRFALDRANKATQSEKSGAEAFKRFYSRSAF